MLVIPVLNLVRLLLGLTESGSVAFQESLAN